MLFPLGCSDWFPEDNLGKYCHLMLQKRETRFNVIYYSRSPELESKPSVSPGGLMSHVLLSPGFTSMNSKQISCVLHFHAASESYYHNFIEFSKKKRQ